MRVYICTCARWCNGIVLQLFGAYGRSSIDAYNVVFFLEARPGGQRMRKLIRAEWGSSRDFFCDFCRDFSENGRIGERFN